MKVAILDRRAGGIDGPAVYVRELVSRVSITTSSTVVGKAAAGRSWSKQLTPRQHSSLLSPSIVKYVLAALALKAFSLNDAAAQGSGRVETPWTGHC